MKKTRKKILQIFVVSKNNSNVIWFVVVSVKAELAQGAETETETEVQTFISWIHFKPVKRPKQIF